MFNRFAQWNVLLTLREALFPVLSLSLAMNVLMMLYGIVTLVQYQGAAAIRMQGVDLDYTQAAEVVRLYFFLIPIFASVSLGYILVRRKKLEPVSTLLTVLVCFLRISGYLSVNPSSELVSSHSSAFICLPVTWLAVHLLHTFSTKSRLRLDARFNEISPPFARALNNIVPVLLTLLCFELLRGLFIGLENLNLIENGLPYLPLKKPIQPILELIIYQVIELGSWMIGLPGDQSALNTFRILYAPKIGEFSIIHYQVFQYVFMSSGGVGATLAVPLVILFSKRISQFKTIAKLSLLFSLINNNLILLFGLPIVFNPLFLIPFFAAPFANMAIALFAIHLGVFQISPEPIPTLLPALYQAYLISNQSPWAVLTQLVCIVVDGCIYYPFLLTASRQFEAPVALSSWLQKSERNFIENAIEQSQELTFVSKQRAMLQEAEASQRLLRRLKQGRFLLYFQPKVEARSLKLIGLEALLRFQDEKGIIRPPTFLPLLYHQGL
ncbi:MAG: EAL domain-containing protein [Phormidesmis sp.]